MTNDTGSAWNFSSLGLGDWKLAFPDVGGSGAQGYTAPSFDSSSTSTISGSVWTATAKPRRTNIPEE